MKAVLMSIQPRWCELIASGKKTVEVRKTKPQIAPPFKVYIYETNWSNNTYWKHHHEGRLGKVIGEFVCDRVDEYRYGVYDGEFCYHIPTVEGEKTCLEYNDAEEYGKGKPLYFWHITDLVIYDEPRELSEFFTHCSSDKAYVNIDCDGCACYQAISVCTGWCVSGGYKPITRPFQSWGYVYERREI